MTSPSRHSSDAYSSDDDASYDLIDGTQDDAAKKDKQLFGSGMADFQASLELSVTRIVQQQLKDFESRLPSSTTEQQPHCRYTFSPSSFWISAGLIFLLGVAVTSYYGPAPAPPPPRSCPAIDLPSCAPCPSKTNLPPPASNVPPPPSALPPTPPPQSSLPPSPPPISSTPDLSTPTHASLSAAELFAKEMGVWQWKESCIMTSPGKYLRAWKGDKQHLKLHVDTAPHCKENERWTVDQVNGRVVLMTNFYGTTGILQAKADGTVGLSDKVLFYTLWTPIKQSNGKWTLRSERGTYLTVSGDGSILHNNVGTELSIHN